MPTTEGDATAELARGAFENPGAPSTIRVTSFGKPSRILVEIPSDTSDSGSCASELELRIGDEIVLDSALRTDSSLNGVGLAVAQGDTKLRAAIGECPLEFSDRPACVNTSAPAPTLSPAGIAALLVALLLLGVSAVRREA